LLDRTIIADSLATLNKLWITIRSLQITFQTYPFSFSYALSGWIFVCHYLCMVTVSYMNFTSWYKMYFTDCCFALLFDYFFAK